MYISIYEKELPYTGWIFIVALGIKIYVIKML